MKSKKSLKYLMHSHMDFQLRLTNFTSLFQTELLILACR